MEQLCHSKNTNTMDDFRLDNTGDIDILNGDFLIGDATLQHQEYILIAQKGEYKENPEIGVGIANTLNDENPRQILTQIRRNYEYDGMQVKSLEIDNDGNISIDAPYNTL